MTGLEPAIPTSVALCSVQLSYMSLKFDLNPHRILRYFRPC
nr:MAG TPA: hypothetical protein [Caudoviricetes sp.]